MKFIQQLKEYVRYKHESREERIITQISKAGLFFSLIIFWIGVSLYLNFHNETEQGLLITLGIIGFFTFLLGGTGLIYFFFYFSFSDEYSARHDKPFLSSLKYFFKSIYLEFIFEPSLKKKLQKNFKEYYQYFSSKNCENEAESFYSSCMDNYIPYYDIRSMHSVFTMIDNEKESSKNKSESTTQYLTLFNEHRFQEEQSSTFSQPLKFFDEKEKA